MVPASLFGASRDGGVAARRAHNPKVGGSNPSPATNAHYAEGQAFSLAFGWNRTQAALRQAQGAARIAEGKSKALRHAELVEAPQSKAAFSSRGVTYPGGQSEVDPPVPIPNTEVKRLSADDTAWATGCGK